VTACSVRLEDLKGLSPVGLGNNKQMTEEILDTLFPGNPLLCFGRSANTPKRIRNYCISRKSGSLGGLWTRAEVLARPYPVPNSAGVYAWFFDWCPEGISAEELWRLFGFLKRGRTPRVTSPTTSQANKERFLTGLTSEWRINEARCWRSQNSHAFGRITTIVPGEHSIGMVSSSGW
jgi:hypothetical protein